MGRFIVEVVMVAASLILGGFLLWRSVVPTRAWRALLAWIPVFVLTRPLRDGWFTGYQWWFILPLLVVGVSLAIIKRFPLVVRLCGLALFVLAYFPAVSWSGPMWFFHDNGGSGNEAAPASTTSTTSTTVPSTTTTTVPPDTGLTADQAKQVATELHDLYPDYHPDEVKTGVGNIPASQEERGAASFTGTTLKNRTMLMQFLKSSDNPKAIAARKNIAQGLKDAGYGDDEVKRAFSTGNNWFWVAPTVASQIKGTTYFVNGQVKTALNWRQVAANDAIWFYVTSDGHIVKAASQRADCGNPRVQLVRPVRTNTPTAPPVTTPPGAKCPYDSSLDVDSPKCLQPKNPAEDVNVNPHVPPQPHGHGTPSTECHKGTGSKPCPPPPKGDDDGCVGTCDPFGTASGTSGSGNGDTDQSTGSSGTHGSSGSSDDGTTGGSDGVSNPTPDGAPPTTVKPNTDPCDATPKPTVCG